eukprot:CAMPEP_0177261242 /NCGR_PEP_ID=MMETSP0367-20130122/59716_1 /TAXON_ID=447022 ORGANISM="Scrippsiella hangoei-like, Strain SHHI-4" /NCGR_SAMPLE_ID=MMETSP0367 /ASSEMBLY_ACC=CAM_ASM_000362 /LENGTH=35 /DNA_ID= /DNA_START= /DNA_END= /DNA_ORIENTATION=
MAPEGRDNRSGNSGNVSHSLRAADQRSAWESEDRP